MLGAVDLTTTQRRSLEGVDGATWNALDHGPSPFLEWGFLRALELSGSVGEAAGWDPHYLLVYGDPSALIEDAGSHDARHGSPDQVGHAHLPNRAGGSVLLGAVAAYVKDHSYGEYIFDFHWARSSMRAGIPYYPKLVIAAPATPATGKRLLLHPRLGPQARAAVVERLIQAVRELADERRCQSIHWLFTTAEEREWLTAADFAPRSSFQFHWHNHDYADFDDFLASLTSRKRKQIRKERQRARAAVDAIRFVPGSELRPAQIAALDRFYRHTTNQYGGSQYLQRGFFDRLVELAPERVRFLEVERGGKPIAGSLFFETEQGLYGRYWGCDEHIEYLHFEASYYVGIERCIERGLPLFEAGAQGEHKLLRGFMPALCHSAHWLRHPGLDKGVREFLREERRAVAQHLEQLAIYGPYRQPEGHEVHEVLEGPEPE